MSVNRPRSAASEPSEKEGASIFTLLDNLLRLDAMFESGLPIRYLPRILFLCGLTILYIGLSHFSRRNLLLYNRTKAEVEELRVQYTTYKAQYMYSSKQSEVARRVAPLGLEESQSPPRVIKAD